MIKFSLNFENFFDKKKFLTYIQKEFSFDMNPAIYEINYYFSLNMLDLTTDENDYVIQVGGFCPYGNWMKTTLSVPKYKPGLLKVETELEPGFSYGINESDWPIYINEDEWVCIGNPEKQKTAVEFLPSCVAVIDQDELVSLWLKPTFI